jgi:hypothetical protein
VNAAASAAMSAMRFIGIAPLALVVAEEKAGSRPTIDGLEKSDLTAGVRR